MEGASAGLRWTITRVPALEQAPELEAREVAGDLPM